MKTFINKYFVYVAMLVAIYSCSNTKESKIGDISLKLFKTRSGKLAYIVRKNSNTIIDTSLLGVTVNGKTLGDNTTFLKSEKKEVKLSYPILGIKRQVSHTGETTKYRLKEKSGINWNIEFHLSDQGVAYRYIIPKKSKNTVNGELSSFKLPEKTKVWYFERDNAWKLKSHAGSWKSADISEMPTVSKIGSVQGLTLTCKLPFGGYALLAEAALFNYSGLRLKAIGNNSFKADFSEGNKGFECVGDIISPWRCIVLADNLNDLVNNTLVASLNPEPDKTLFKNSDWIVPGKTAWFWWSGNEATYDDEVKMVDAASKLGFQYTMVDDGWEKWQDKWNSLKKLCEYADAKGVKIFVWKHSKEINSPNDNFLQMKTFLNNVKQAGAVGVKVDFMNGHSASIIKFDEMLLKLSAERKLMVNFHGCQQSSGEYRTYPNEVTREGIRGTELNKMAEGPVSASHNTALPFTRFVAGHADYTPLVLTAPGETTWAHQLATLVCFHSPFQCIAENPDFLLNDTRVIPALDFIKHVPTIWDETIVLEGSKIGELTVMARRKGDNWYIGVLNAGKDKEISITTDFLSPKTYKTQTFTDNTTVEPISLKGLNPLANISKSETTIPFKRNDSTHNKRNKISLKLAKNGGAVVWLKEK